MPACILRPERSVHGPKAGNGEERIEVELPAIDVGTGVIFNSEGCGKAAVLLILHRESPSESGKLALIGNAVALLIG